MELKLLLACLLLGASSFANASLELQGYIKTYHLGISQKNISGLPESLQPGWTYQSLTAARAQLNWTPKDWVNVELGYELIPTFQATDGNSFGNLGSLFSSASATASGNRYRLVDTRARLFGGGDDAFASQNLDRINIRWMLPFGDLTVGRQAVTFGSSRGLSPADVFLPFGLQQVNIEYRIGIDAVRFQVPISQMGELDFGAIIGQDGWASNSALWARTRLALLGGDWEWIGVAWNDAWMTSLGVQRGLWKFGFWAEASVTLGDAVPTPFARASTGLDYAFANEPSLFVEYHYNGAGSTDPADYLSQLSTFAYTKGGVFLLGQHFLIPGVSWQITPLWSASNQLFFNLTDPSAFWSVSTEVNIAENWYADLGIFATLGKPLSTDGVNIQFRSEYGAYPLFFYGDLRFYF